MFDNPGKHKIHEHYTPSLGGIAIVLGAVVAMLVALPFHELSKSKYFLIALSLIFITGLRDDILTLSPKQKLFSQLLPIALLVILGRVQLTSFYDISSEPFPTWLSWVISIFTITILTNAYNLIDGIDGFAGAIATVGFLFFGIWFGLAGDLTLSVVSATFCGGTLAFLFFNWQPAKIFMGDTGSLTLGLLLSFLSVQFINHNFSLTGQESFHFEASIATAISILIIPIFDTLRVIIIRISRLESPFKADRNHLHHQLLAVGCSHSSTVLILTSFNLFVVAVAYILRSQSDAVILPTVMGSCLAAHLILKAFRKSFNGKKSTIP